MSHVIELKRRSIQSYVEISPFSLDESRSPFGVNNTFLSFRIRDKSRKNEVRNEENCGAINPDCSDTACCWSDSRRPAFDLIE
jgi:hypothetical protein